LGLHLEVAHLEHGIRGEEARQDALHVAKMAEALALRFHLKRVDLPGMKAEERKGNLEQMGREERHRFFAALTSDYGLSKVATGHTRDDQVETFFMWLLRGSGRKGLGGMPPIRRLTPEIPEEVSLIRPLIEISRQEIIDYLTAHGLAYRTDQTNLDSHPLRNWIRLQLLPQLRQRIDSRLDERLAQLTSLFREEEAILEDLARGRLQGIVQGENLLLDPFLQEKKGMQRRLIRLWLEGTLGDLRAMDFDHIEEALGFVAQGPPQGRLSIPRKWELVKQYGTVRLERRKPMSKPTCYSYALQQPGELIVSEAQVKILSSRGGLTPGVRPENNLEAVFDLDALPGMLTVRNFRNGDRFQPLGMKGHRKVKDLFIEKKVPLKVRATLPLLLAGGEILWIPGYGRSEVAKIGPQTRKVLRVKLLVASG
jgi:tRNA(Ile)-lysidine synthase